MGPIISISPFKCRMWALHDRLEEHITEDSCKAEIESFQENGQLVPVLGRSLRGDPNFEVELIYGARRLFIARTINRPLLVELRDLSDRDAIIAMDTENRHRKDISPYERGLCYARWLRGGQFQSQEDIAHALRISVSQVSRLLKIARLPSVVVNAFASAVDICAGWGLDIAEALEDPRRRERTIHTARALAVMKPRLSPEEVYRRLLAASAPGAKPRKTSHDQIIKAPSGSSLFRIAHRRDAIALLLPVEKVSAKTLRLIESKVTEILLADHSEPSDETTYGRRQAASRSGDPSVERTFGATTEV